MFNDRLKNIKLKLITGILLLTNFGLHGQYLNLLQETDSIYEYSYNFNYDRDEFVGICSYQDSNWNISGWTGLMFSAYDQNYNKINIKQFYDPNYSYYSGWGIAYDGEAYYYPGFKLDNPSPDSIKAYVMKFDTLGNVIWERNYFTDSENAQIYYCRSKNDSLYVAGIRRVASTNELQSFIMNLDSSGVIGWTKYFIGDGQATGSFRFTSDNGFIYTTIRQLGFNTPTSVYKLDSLGIVEWETLLTYPTNAHYVSAYEEPNGNFLCYGYSEDPLTTRKRSWLVELSSSGLILQDSIIDYSIGYDGFGSYSKPLFYNDGFQLIGVFYDDEFSNTSKVYVARYDYNFNLLWKREYFARDTDNGFAFQHDLGNGFTLFAGNASQDSPINTSDEWFLVLDSMGCDVSNCNLGIKGLTDVDEVKIYPNPMSYNTTVSFNEVLTEATTINLYSTTGELLYSDEINEGVHDYKLSRGNIPAGLYLLTLKSDTFYWTERLVIK